MTGIALERVTQAGYDAWPTWAVHTRRVHVLTHIIPPMKSVALCGLMTEWATDSQLGDGRATCRTCCIRFERQVNRRTA